MPFSRSAVKQVNAVELARVYSAMQDNLNIPLIFPIKDTASAALMVIKAECLHKAGIIDEAEKQYVHSRARKFLDDVTLKDVA